MNLPTAFFLSLLLGSAAYAAGRVHAGVGYRFGYRFGYRQGYFDGDLASWNRRRREEQLAISAALRDRPATECPVVERVVVEPPVVAHPVVEQPVVAHPVVEQVEPVVVERPVTVQPATAQPVAAQPVAAKLVVEPVGAVQAPTEVLATVGTAAVIRPPIVVKRTATATGRATPATPGTDRVPLDRVALDRSVHQRGTLDPLVVGQRPVAVPDEVVAEPLVLVGRGRTYGRAVSTGRHAQTESGTG